MRRISWFLLLVLLLIVSSGCAQKKRARVVFPPPPQTPKMEYIGVYAAEADLKSSPGERTVQALTGDVGAIELLFPFGVVADGHGQVFVSDPGAHNIRIFDFNKKMTEYYLKTSVGKPYRLMLDAQERLYVVVPETKNILVFSKEHKPLFNFGAEVLEKPSGLAIDNQRQRVYVTDVKLGTIEVFDLTGSHLSSLAGRGTEPGKLAGPSGLALDKDGNIFVADTLNARIQAFTPEGELIRAFGLRSDRTSGFEMPKDLAFDSEGHLHIVDSRKGGIQTFSPEGQLLLYTGMGKPTTSPLGLGIANSIYIDANDRIYLADFLNKRLAVWQYLSAAYLKAYPLTEEDLKAYAPPKE